MFGWIGAGVALETGEKAWIESRLKLVADRMGIDRLLRSRLLPADPAAFPELADDLHNGAVLRSLFDRVGRVLGVATGDLDLVLTAGEAGVGPEGRPGVRLDPGRVHDAEALVAALARGLARHRLEGIEAATGCDEAEDRARAELLALAHGLGVPLANATLHEGRLGEGKHRSSEVARLGELPAHMIGYALALWVYVREENGQDSGRGDLARRLRPDARITFRGGLRHIERTGDTLFHPDTLRMRERPVSVAEAVERLRSGTPTRKLATLWSVRDQDLSHPNLVAPATALLEGRDSDLAAAAAEVLGHQRGEPAPATVASLLRVARHGDRRASVAALTALADLKVPASELMPALGALLIDDDPEIARAAARIAATGAEPGPAPSTSPEFGPLVLEALVRGLVTCEDRLIAASADALRALGGLDQDSTRSAFRALDSELRRRVRGALDDMGEGT